MNLYEYIIELQNFLSSLRLNPQLAQTKTIEIDLKGELNPAVLFGRYFFEKKQYLDFEQFFRIYIEKNWALLIKQFGDIDQNIFLEGLKARLYRTQCGLLTEYHAFFAFQYIFGANQLRRSADLDRIGVDFQLLFQKKLYNIHIFVDTKRAWDFRNQKIAHKSSNHHKGIHVNLPYSLAANRFNSLQYLSNGFGIYTSKYLYYFKNELESERILHYNIIGTNAEGFVYETK